MLQLQRRANIIAVFGYFLCLFIILKAMPPFFAPDETTHWAWASRFFHFDTVSDCTHSEKIISAYPFEEAYRSGSAKFPGWSALEQKELSCPQIPPSGSYVFFSSYPNVLLANILHSPFQKYTLQSSAEVYELSRWLNFMFFVFFISYFWIKEKNRTTGPSKFLYFLVGILSFPIVAQQSIAVGTDACVILASLALCAFILYAETLSYLEAFIFSLFILAGALSKPVMLPLVVFAAFWCGPRFKKFTPLSALLLLPIITVALRGLFFMKNLGGTTNAAIIGTTAAQKEYILSHPLSSLYTIMHWSLEKSFGLPGSRLSWLSFSPPGIAQTLYHLPIILGLLFVVKDLKRFVLDLKRIKLTAVFWAMCWLGFLFLIGFSFYLTLSGVGSARVEGIQSRYYMPLWIFSAALLSKVITKNKSLDKTWARLAIFQTILMCAANLIVFFAIRERFW